MTVEILEGFRPLGRAILNNIEFFWAFKKKINRMVIKFILISLKIVLCE